MTHWESAFLQEESGRGGKGLPARALLSAHHGLGGLAGVLQLGLGWSHSEVISFQFRLSLLSLTVPGMCAVTKLSQRAARLTLTDKR